MFEHKPKNDAHDWTWLLFLIFELNMKMAVTK